jgi:hypothetical protein
VKSAGYFISVGSVVMLAVPAYQSASKDRALLACLTAGVTASIIGMVLRWLSYRAEQKAGS